MHGYFQHSASPLYAQIADALRERIVKGVWAIGTQIPTLPELAQEFGVGLITVRQAVQLLKDERLLVPAVDAELATLDAEPSPALAKLKVRWGYLKAALSDMNSKSNTLASVSGRPFAPTTVDRHSRAMTQQWMALY